MNFFFTKKANFYKKLDDELIENARDGNCNKVRDLLCRGLLGQGPNVNARDVYGNTALMYASDNGHLDVVRLLLYHHGVEVNMKKDYSAAHCFAHNENVKPVNGIIYHHHGLNVNTKNDHGYTALICASSKGHLEVVRMLLNYNGVDVNVKDKYGRTALDVARDKEQDAIARLLEEHMAHEKHRQEEEEQKRREVAQGTKALEQMRRR